MTTIARDLANISQNHMPSSSVFIAKDMNRSILYAEFVLSSNSRGASRVKASEDIDTIEKLYRSLQSVLNVTKELSYDGKSNISNYLTPFSQHTDKYEDMEPYVDFILNVTVAMTAVNFIRENNRFKRKASAKRNWRAVGVARCCRMIWAMEEWYSKPDKYGTPPRNALLDLNEADDQQLRYERIEYEAHIRTFAPRTQNHNRPGPFGRYLEDIFGTLGIVDGTGQAVSAGVALDSLKSIECQE